MQVVWRAGKHCARREVLRGTPKHAVLSYGGLMVHVRFHYRHRCPCTHVIVSLAGF